MKKYVITFSNVSGSVTIHYAAGRLTKLFIEASFNDTQLLYFLCNCPISTSGMASFAAKHPHISVVETNAEISFDEFYNAFGNKVGRNRAESAWKRMSEADRLAAYLYIPRYKTYLKTNTWAVPMHPITFLNQKRWED